MRRPAGLVAAIEGGSEAEALLALTPDAALRDAVRRFRLTDGEPSRAYRAASDAVAGLPALVAWRRLDASSRAERDDVVRAISRLKVETWTLVWQTLRLDGEPRL